MDELSRIESIYGSVQEYNRCQEEKDNAEFESSQGWGAECEWSTEEGIGIPLSEMGDGDFADFCSLASSMENCVVDGKRSYCPNCKHPYRCGDSWSQGKGVKHNGKDYQIEEIFWYKEYTRFWLFAKDGEQIPVDVGV